MKTTVLRQISPKDCLYTLNGRNLAEVRRTHIEKIANSLDLPFNTSKNEMLGLIMAKLDSLGADKELADLKPKKKKAKK